MYRSQPEIKKTYIDEFGETVYKTLEELDYEIGKRDAELEDYMESRFDE